MEAAPVLQSAAERLGQAAHSPQGKRQAHHMAHDVFISYSTQDKSVADAMCHHLEERRVRCWIAPRDVPPGAKWGSAIIDAIGECRVMVLVFSANADRSDQVLREVNTAVEARCVIVPFRIDGAPLSKDMKFFLGPLHWLDAFTPPIEDHLDRLCDRIDGILATFPKTAHDAVEPAKPKPVPAQPAAPQKPADPLAMKLQEIRQEQARALAAVRTRLAQEIERRAFAPARETVAQLLALQPNDADAHAAKAFIERELEAEGKRRAEEARLAQEAEAQRRREQEQRNAEELRRQEIVRREEEERKRQLRERQKALEQEREEKARREEEEREKRQAAQREAEERKKELEIAALRERLRLQWKQGKYAEVLVTASTLERLSPYDWQAWSARHEAERNLAQQKLLPRFSVSINELPHNEPLLTTPVSNTDPNIGVYQRHEAGVTCLAAFPDGRRIVSGADDGGLHVWDRRSLTTLHTLKGHAGLVSSVTLSATGRYVVSGGDDSHIAVWNIETAQCVRVLFHNGTRVRALAMLAGGRHLASVAGNELMIWDLETGEALRSIVVDNQINCVALLPDGLEIVLATDATVESWNLEMLLDLGWSGKAKEITGGAKSLIVLQDGRAVLAGAMASGRTWVSVRHLATSRELQRPREFDGVVTCGTATPDGNHVVYGTNDGNLVVWDLQRSKARNCIKCHKETITCVTASLAGGNSCIVTGSTDESVRMWRFI